MSKNDPKSNPATPKGDGNPKRKYAGDLKITLLTDKDGKPYGPNNNPKREGSKTAKNFALYENGMTIDGFIAKGGTYAEVVWDVDKGFISVK